MCGYLVSHTLGALLVPMLFLPFGDEIRGPFVSCVRVINSFSDSRNILARKTSRYVWFSRVGNQKVWHGCCSRQGEKCWSLFSSLFFCLASLAASDAFSLALCLSCEDAALLHTCRDIYIRLYQVRVYSLSAFVLLGVNVAFWGDQHNDSRSVTCVASKAACDVFLAPP